eukprot:TRINITY_DN5995_c0_g1_i1.p1 TRINITY_DN5995_c0_g1~~TRINITY_DN5995_c0_g1_i1.p1  ORF type:complete len:291 (+),score=86.32 TRINITY_DN5995_c0_g1_i1:50-874(+)
MVAGPRPWRCCRPRRPLPLRPLRRCSAAAPPDSGEPAAQRVQWWALWRTARGRWLLAALSVGYAAALYTLSRWADEAERRCKERAAAAAAATAAESLRLGGDFELTTHTGDRLDTATLRGRWWLVYFGFASCPTVCPAELRKVTALINALEKRFGDGCLLPLFVTVDPDRDTPERLADFLRPFHPRLVGLTGTREEVAAVAKLYRVYYGVIDTDDLDLESGRAPDDYQIDHSCLCYLMSPEGRFVDFFSKESDARAAEAKVARHLEGLMDHLRE